MSLTRTEGTHRAGSGAGTTLEESYRYAAGLTRASARNFVYAFWFLTPERRRSIAAIYAFSRRLDDCVDSSVDGKVDKQEALRELARLGGILHEPAGGQLDDQLGPALRHTIRRFDIPLSPFLDLISGMEMDLKQVRYRTFEELRDYCYRAASTVGLICIEIFGNSGAAAHQPAIDLGIAMQLTNVLRDIPEDFQRGRIYLPTEDLERCHYSEEELARQVVNDSFRELMAFQVSRAREYFARAEPLLLQLQPKSRRCPALMARFYRALLDRIERKGYDVYRKRPRLSILQKLTLAGTHILQKPRVTNT